MKTKPGPAPRPAPAPNQSRSRPCPHCSAPALDGLCGACKVIDELGAAAWYASDPAPAATRLQWMAETFEAAVRDSDGEDVRIEITLAWSMHRELLAAAFTASEMAAESVT